MKISSKVAAFIFAGITSMAAHSGDPYADYTVDPTYRDANGKLDPKKFGSTAGKKFSANGRELFKQGQNDEETATKFQGGNTTPTGKISSASGIAGRSVSNVELLCDPTSQSRTKWALTFRASYCDPTAAVIDFCTAFRDEGRYCQNADFTQTPIVYVGRSYNSADFSFVLTKVENRRAFIEVTETYNRNLEHKTLAEQGAAKVAGQSQDSQYNKNRSFSQSATPSSNGDTYASINARSGAWVNRNEKVFSHWKATGDLKADNNACFQGKCGQNFGQYKADYSSGDCTTTCNQTTTQEVTQFETCTVLPNKVERYCQRPVSDQIIYQTRSYNESRCNAGATGIGCPSSQNSRCWKYRTGQETVQTQFGPVTTSYDYYRCDTGNPPTETSTQGIPPAECDKQPQVCIQNDPTARNDTTYGMGTCLQKSQSMTCPTGPFQCDGGNPIDQTDPACTTTPIMCRADGNTPGYCPPITSDSTTDGEPNGDGPCTCQGQGQTCTYGAPEDSCAPLRNRPECVRSGSKPALDEEGETIGTEYTYTCTYSQTQCSDSTTTCSDSVTPTPNAAGLEQVAAAGEFMRRVSEGNAKADGLGSIKLFGGEAADCKRPLNLGPATQNCCKLSLTKEEAALFNSCNEEDVKIASARRGTRAIEFPSFCSKKISLGFTKICTERTSSFCIFDSKLARIVQVQGRDQLSAILGSSGGSGAAPVDVSFDYYSGNATAGIWKQLGTINGIQFRAFQWPSNCAAAVNRTGTADTRCMVTDDIYFATCEGTTCPALPADPRLGPPLNSDWEFTALDRDEAVITDLGKRSLATGSCPINKKDANGKDIIGANGKPVRNTTCAYSIAGLRAAAGGKTMARLQVDWPIFELNEGFMQDGVEVAGFRFRPYQLSEQGAQDPLPSTLKLEVYKLDDTGAVTASDLVIIPTKQPKMTNINIFGEPWQFSGSCRKDLTLCRYAFMAPKPVTDKPWCLGRCRKPTLDCSGFTPDQFSLLDLGQMDLTEIAEEVNVPLPPPAPIIVDTAAPTSRQKAGQAPSLGGDTEAVRLLPNNGDPVWEAKLTVATTVGRGNGQERIQVNGFRVSWGDGTPDTTSSSPPSNGIGWSAPHIYNQIINGVDMKNATFNVKVDLFLASGSTRTFNLKAYNWRNDKPKDLSEGTNASSGAGTVDTRSTPSGSVSQFPPPPQPK